MSVADCVVCRKLMREFSVISSRHLDAVRLLDSTLQFSPSRREGIAVLERLVAACAQEREDAIERFQTHSAGHSHEALGQVVGHERVSSGPALIRATRSGER